MPNESSAIETSGSIAAPIANEASKMLSSAREKMGLSQKEIADQLYLTTTFIKYIDDAEFDKIPKPAFIKGYLRTYARIVGLDGDDVVRRYEQEVEAVDENVGIRNVTEETVGSAKFTGPVVQTGLIGLVGVVVVIGLVWFMVSGDEETPAPAQVEPPFEDLVAEPSFDEQSDFDFVQSEVDNANSSLEASGLGATDIDAADIDTAGTAQETASVAAEVFEDPEALALETEPAIDSEAIPAAAVTSRSSVAAEELNPVTVTRERQEEGFLIVVDAGGTDEIEMTFSDECWVEVEDGDRTEIYGDLNRASDVLRITGIGPFEVLLGRATAVQMTYNGTRVDVARVTTSDETAKVRLGRR